MSIDPKAIHQLLTQEYSEMVNNPQFAKHEKVEILKKLFPKLVPPETLTSYALNLIFGEDQRILDVFKNTYGSSENGLILDYLELNTWESKGNKKKAIEIIINAYRNGFNSVDLSDMELTSLPNGLYKLANLNMLTANRNSLDNFPSDFGKMTHLKYLSVSYNNFSKFPDEVWQLPNLEFLHADYNKLESISKNTNLPKLVHLYLSNNRLEKVPDAIENIPSLNILNLSSNKIKEVSPKIGNLTKLSKLYLENNSIATLPNSIKKLNKLTDVNISSNNLTDISSFYEISELHTINYSQNQIEEDPHSKFKGFVHQTATGNPFHKSKKRKTDSNE